jgi:hypothetical protein
MERTERQLLLRDLRRLKDELPQLIVKQELLDLAVGSAQDQVDRITQLLEADELERNPPPADPPV